MEETDVKDGYRVKKVYFEKSVDCPACDNSNSLDVEANYDQGVWTCKQCGYKFLISDETKDGSRPQE